MADVVFCDNPSTPMALAAGTRIGVYEITGPLGAGGMGEVYRARDARLKREVALKILPASVASDPDRLARFQREAEVLASLDHPNIGAIYGVEDSDGHHALVLQLVEGDTLAERIARGPLPLEEALPIARQIAGALEAAHELGIVHRDLKPANVKITPDGVVKVLDFGLAKLADAGRGPDTGYASQAPTITTPAMTGIGMILGTAAYMSPEQAKGRPADKRSDVWAFGCVLYEMLTGRRAFEGDDVADTLATVLKGEPDWKAIPASGPPLLRLLIAQCLDKDRARRLGDMAAVRFALGEATLATAANTPSAAVPVTGRRRVVWAAAVIAALGAVAVLAWLWPAAPAAPRVTRFVHTLPEGDVLTDVFFPAVAISRDGTQMVYAANQQLHLRRMTDAVSRPIAGTETRTNMGFPTFSPDGRSIAFWVRTGSPNTTGNTKGEIRRVPIEGGTPFTIASVESVPNGMSWESEWLVFAQSGGNVMRVRETGSTPQTLVEIKAGMQARGAQLLGDETVLFTVKPGGNLGPVSEWDQAEIVVQSLTSGERKTLTRGTAARVVSTGHLLFVQRGAVMAAPFDVRRNELTGPAVPVIEGVLRATTGGAAGGDSLGDAHFAVSETGTVAYVSGPPTGSLEERRLVLVDRAGKIETLPPPPGFYESPRVSADGKRLAVGTVHSGTATISIYDLSGSSALRRLTFEGNNRFPVWSADGQYVSFQSDREKDLAVFRQRADGATPAERLTTPKDGAAHAPEAWFPGGDLLLFRERKNLQNSLRIYSESSKTIVPLGGAPSGQAARAGLSPDGRWVVYTTASGGQGGISLRPFPPTGAEYEVAVPARFPRWSPDGRQVLFTRLGQVWIVEVTTTGGVTIGNPVALPRQVANVLGPFYDYDIMPDGRFLASSAGGTEANQQEIQVVLNWFEELKARVPSK